MSQYKIPLLSSKCWFELNNIYCYIFPYLSNKPLCATSLLDWGCVLCSYRVECSNCETGEQCGAIMHGNAVTFCEPYGPRELVSRCYLCALFQIHCLYWSLLLCSSGSDEIYNIVYIMNSITKYLKIGSNDFMVYFQL